MSLLPPMSMKKFFKDQYASIFDGDTLWQKLDIIDTHHL